MLSSFTAVANQIAATTKRTEKERLLADYLAGLDDASLERAAVFFTGSPFPGRDERVTSSFRRQESVLQLRARSGMRATSTNYLIRHARVETKGW